MQLGAAAFTDGTDTSFQLLATADDPYVNIGDILETPNGEMILITAKSGSPATFTCARGYAGTSALAIAQVNGTVLLKNPTWERRKVRRSVEQFFQTLAHAHLPYVATVTVNRASIKKNWAELPSTTVCVLRVGFVNPQTDQWSFYDAWTEEHNLPSAVSTTTKMLVFQSFFDTTLDLHVTVQQQYAWTGGSASTETGTIPCPQGAEDLPALYAAAVMASRREITRDELDKVEEWSEEMASRQGLNLQLIRLLWTEFYRRLEEAKKTHIVPRAGRRPYRARARIPNLNQLTS